MKTWKQRVVLAVCILIGSIIGNAVYGQWFAPKKAIRFSYACVSSSYSTDHLRMRYTDHLVFSGGTLIDHGSFCSDDRVLYVGLAKGHMEIVKEEIPMFVEDRP